MDEETRLKARELLLRARIYRFMALTFAVMGVVTFIILYFRYVADDGWKALADIKLVVILLFPFLPASYMSWLAVRTEKRFVKLLADLAEKAGGAKKSAKS